MKTHVIQLEPHDDLTSVRDKMSWAKAGRVLLVFPRRPRILARTLDLRLLQRHAAGLGAQLAIVARADDLRRAAAGLGLPVFETAAAAQRQAWARESGTPLGPPRRERRPDLRKMRRDLSPPEPAWRNHLALRLALFTLAALAVIALLMAMIPSAVIRLTPQTRLQALTFAVSASPDVTAVRLAGDLPARLATAFGEGNQTTVVTGTTEVPDEPAVGLVRFRNLTAGVIGIPAGTIVRTLTSPPVRFATTDDAVVDGGPGRTVDVPAEALQAGSSGNLPAEALLAVEGDLGASLAVTNPGPTGGGSDRAEPIQTAEDRARLRAGLLAGLLGQCQEALRQSLADGDLLFPGTASLSQVLSETYFPAEGQAGGTLSLTMSLQCQAQYASAEDLRGLAAMVLDASLPAAFAPLPGDLAVESITTPQTDADGVTRWEVSAQRSLRARPDPLAVVQLALGRAPGEASRRLTDSLPLAAAPEIRLSPSWWPWMPLVPFRISVFMGD